MSKGEMDVFECIKTRRSIRAYQKREIEEEKLFKILEAARLAPSAHNHQPWKFIVVRDEKKKDALVSACCGQEFVRDAACLIVGLGLKKHRFKNGLNSNAIDVTIALEHIVLEAWEEGIGSCWILAFWPDEVRKILEIPEDIDIVGILTLGYPAENPMPRPRKDLEEIVCWEKYC